jgi:hypothetical protein
VIRHQFGWVVKTLATESNVVWIIWARLREIHQSRLLQIAHLSAKTRTTQTRYGFGTQDIGDPALFVQGLQDVEERMFKSRPPLLYVRPLRWFSATKGFGRDLLLRAAKAIRSLLREQGQDAQYFVFGHDHNAAVEPLGEGAWYYNTGTWALIEGERERFFRETREFTYVKITPGADDEAQLLRWNEGPKRGERVILMADARKGKR